MKDYVNVKAPKQAQEETLLESVAAGIAAIALAAMIVLLALLLSV